MSILFIDYETYWSDEITLKKLPNSLYIRHPEFKAHGCAVAFNDGPSEWISGKYLREFWADIAPQVFAVCAHNGAFDHSITAHHFCNKRFYLMDTLSMAVGLLSAKHPDLSMSLAGLAKFLFPNDPDAQKFDGFINNTKGVRDLAPHLERSVADYAKRDNDVCRRIFLRLIDDMLPDEMDTIDLTLAMNVFPTLRMNNRLAAQIHDEEVNRKEDTADTLGIDREILRSDECFAQLLREFGVEPPVKVSKRTGQTAYAFSKSDTEFKKLLGHEEPMVAELVAARLGERAAQLEKRAAMFARLPSPCPVPLAYHKAHTGRHAGEEFNMQNLGRGSRLRECLEAPEGRAIVVADLGQIELRMNAWFCQEEWLLAALRDGRDVYCEMASDIFGKVVTKADEHERYVGKQAELSCGYQSGHARFYETLRVQGVQIIEEEAQLAVKAYRAKHPAIVGMWKWLQKEALMALAGITPPVYVDHAGVRFFHQEVLLPSGRSLHYPELQYHDAEGEWRYRVNKKRNMGREWKKIYGGALLENLIQAMARDVFMFHLRQTRMWNPVMAVHDEAVLCPPEEFAHNVAKELEAIMRVPPQWCADVPLTASAGVGKNYAEAKKNAG